MNKPKDAKATDVEVTEIVVGIEQTRAQMSETLANQERLSPETN